MVHFRQSRARWPSPPTNPGNTMRTSTLPLHHTPQRSTITAGMLAALLTVAGLGLLLAGCPVSSFNKRNARPWQPKLAIIFDDTTDVCAPWVDSTEPWARLERELTAKRCQETDLVAVGTIQEVVDTLSGAAIKQVVLQFQVNKMLRGNIADLPGGTSRVTLVVSRSEDARIPKRMLRRNAVLSIRWLRGEDPPFRWHLTCATKGVIPLVQKHTKARKRKERDNDPQQ